MPLIHPYYTHWHLPNERSKFQFCKNISNQHIGKLYLLPNLRNTTTNTLADYTSSLPDHTLFAFAARYVPPTRSAPMLSLTADRTERRSHT